MEDADLVGVEGTDDGVQQAAVVEHDEVALLPVVRVYKLDNSRVRSYEGRKNETTIPRAQCQAAASRAEACEPFQGP